MGNLNCLRTLHLSEQRAPSLQDSPRPGLQTLMGEKESPRRGLQTLMKEKIHTPERKSSTLGQAGPSSSSTYSPRPHSTKSTKPGHNWKFWKKRSNSFSNSQPRNITELTESIFVNKDLITITNFEDCVEDIIGSLEDNPWAHAFYMFLKKKDQEHQIEPCQCRPACDPHELSNMFIFCILASNLKQTDDIASSNERLARRYVILQMCKQIFFTEGVEFKSAFKFSTFVSFPMKKEKIISLFNGDLSEESTQEELKKLIQDLREEDENIDDFHDKDFKDFTNNHPEAHPKNVVQRALSKISN